MADEKDGPVGPESEDGEQRRPADEQAGSGGGQDSPVDPLDLSVPVTELSDPATGASPGTDAGEDTGQDDGSTPEPVDVAGSTTVDESESGATPEAEASDAPPADGADEREPEAPAPPATGWRALGRTMRPRPNRSQLLAALLCAALGFALVVQVQQSAQDPLTSARQDDLVRLLDEVTQRAEQLEDEVAELSRTRDELQSGSGQAQAAVDLAEERASAEGILSGRLPAVGPGLEITIRDPDGLLDAAKLFNVLEELRNAGAEVVELNGVRLVTSTWFLDSEQGVTVDGQVLDSPYRWTVIGDPDTLNPALEIPGGALATVRTAGAQATTTDHEQVEVTAVREPAEPQYATPQPPEG